MSNLLPSFLEEGSPVQSATTALREEWREVEDMVGSMSLLATAGSSVANGNRLVLRTMLMSVRVSSVKLRSPLSPAPIVK